MWRVGQPARTRNRSPPSVAPIYFLADAPRDGRALWVTDGTAPGTSLVKKLAANWFYDFEAGDESLYFWADDGRHGSELWRWMARPKGPGWSVTSRRT